MKIFNENITDTIISLGSGQIAAFIWLFNSDFVDIGLRLLMAFLIAFVAAFGSLVAKSLWSKIKKKIK